MKGRWSICILGTLFLLSLIVSAGSGQQFGGPPWPPEQERAPVPKERAKGQEPEWEKKEIREMLETLRIWKMTKALELTEEQSLKIFPKMREIENAREEAGKQKARILMDLQKLLKEEKPDIDKVKESLNAIEKVDSELRSREERLREELKTILSPLQQAKFYIFQKEFEEDVKRMIAEVRGLRQKSMERKWSPQRK